VLAADWGSKVFGNSSVAGGQTYSGAVPPVQMPSAILLSGLGFQHQLEQFGSANLTTVAAFRVESVNAPGPGKYVPTVRHDEPSFINLTEQAASGSLTWTAPTGDLEWRISASRNDSLTRGLTQAERYPLVSLIIAYKQPTISVRLVQLYPPTSSTTTLF